MHWSLLPRPSLSLNVPSKQGSGAEAPASQKEAATQSKHAVWPLSFMKLPAAQAAQLPWLPCGCTVPGLHAVGSAAPVEQNDPDGHATQSSSLVIDRLSAVIVAFWWRPDGHGSAADAPASQYEPATHSKHAVSPGPCWYLPATHLAHVPCSVAGCTVPGLHAVGCAAPVEQNEPAGQPMHSSALVIT